MKEPAQNDYFNDKVRFAEVLSCAKDEKKMDRLLTKNLDRYMHLSSDSVRVIFILTEIDLNALNDIKNKKGTEVVDMCKAWDDHWKSGEKAGIMIGEERGIEKGIEVFVKDKILDGVDESIIVKKLVFFYQVSDEKAKGYIEKYRQMI